MNVLFPELGSAYLYSVTEGVGLGVGQKCNDTPICVHCTNTTAWSCKLLNQTSLRVEGADLRDQY